MTGVLYPRKQPATTTVAVGALHNVFCPPWHRFSSRDFEQEELGECVLDEVLEPGDLLYMPRGLIHQVRRVVGPTVVKVGGLFAFVSCRISWRRLLTPPLPTVALLQLRMALRVCL